MSVLTIVLVVAVLVVCGLALSVRIAQQYERGVLFRLGRVNGVREPGLRVILPLVEVLRRVSLRIVTMPIQSQGIITRDNVSIDVSNTTVVFPAPLMSTIQELGSFLTREQTAGSAPPPPPAPVTAAAPPRVNPDANGASAAGRD